MKQKFKGVMKVFVLCSKLFSFVWLAKSKNNNDKKRRLPWDKNVHTNSLSKNMGEKCMRRMVQKLSYEIPMAKI